MISIFIATLSLLVLSILGILAYRMNRKTALQPIPVEKRKIIRRR